MPNLVSVCTVSQALLTQDKDITPLMLRCLGKSHLNPDTKIAKNTYNIDSFIVYFLQLQYFSKTKQLPATPCQISCWLAINK